MRLPRASDAVIERRKLTDYLLSPTHPVGKKKARVFRALGFSEGNADLFEQRLRTIAENEEVEEAIPSPHETKYTVTRSNGWPSWRVGIYLHRLDYRIARWAAATGNRISQREVRIRA